MITSRISTNTWVMLSEYAANNRKGFSDWSCARWCRLDLDRKRVANKYYYPSSGGDCFIPNFFGSSVSTRLKAALVLSFIPIVQHSTDYYYWQLVRETGWPWPWAANGQLAQYRNRWVRLQISVLFWYLRWQVCFSEKYSSLLYWNSALRLPLISSDVSRGLNLENKQIQAGIHLR